MPVKILVVEDDAGFRQMLSICLSQTGYEPIDANSGEEAIALALRDHPDVILMDLGLPGMSGIEAAEVLKRNPQTAKIPIIAVTARPAEPWKEKAVEAGISLYLTKPASLEAIIQAIESALSTPA